MTMRTSEEPPMMMTVLAERLQLQWFRPVSPAAGGDQPTLVLLHEALGSIGQWRDFPRSLANATGLAVMAYDRCGFGGSQPLAAPRGLDYLERELASLDALLSLCAIRRPLVFGLSDGATLSLLYAATYPERALAVI